MNFIKLLFLSLVDILIKLPTQWLKFIITLIKNVAAWVKDVCRRTKRPHSEVNATEEDCGPIRHPSFHRADPLIYSQKYLKSIGLAVTWNNPDIVLKRNGIIVTENDLLPDTDYVIEATIWNNSYEAPAVGVGVDFSFLSFGAGTTVHTIGSKSANLGVKGGANHPAKSEIKWRTPVTPGHYCLQVQLNWYDDVNPANNLGQNNVSIKEPQSPALFDFILKNDTGKPQTYRLVADTYELPTLQPCDKKKIYKNKGIKWNDIKDIHNPAHYPIPQDWSVAIIPQSVNLSANEEETIHVSIEPPNDFRGVKAFNINAFYGNTMITGGVTLYVSKP
jgi:hypothetical protein